MSYEKTRPLVVACLLTAVLSGTPAGAQTTPAPGAAASDPAAFIQRFDRSGKGLLDMKAVLNAAIVKFGTLDTEKRGRMTAQQLAGLLTPEEFKTANPDGDTTIGAEEWFDLVRRYFYAANPDNDGSLSIDELKTPAGQALLKLIQ
ncbi:MAG TPA: hypothetical protein VGC15_18370 [Acetobacteraceae bacterium]